MQDTHAERSNPFISSRCSARTCSLILLKEKTVLSQSSEMCREKEIFLSSKTRPLYLERFQVNTLFPAFVNQHFPLNLPGRLWSEGEPGAEEAVITRSRSSYPIGDAHGFTHLFYSLAKSYNLSILSQVNRRISPVIQFSYLHFCLESLTSFGDGGGGDPQQDGLLRYGELQV